MAQQEDPYLLSLKNEFGKENKADFSIRGDSILRYQNRFCVPSEETITNQILEEAHCGLYTVHPGHTKCIRICENMIGRMT